MKLAVPTVKVVLSLTASILILQSSYFPLFIIVNKTTNNFIFFESATIGISRAVRS